MDADLSLVMEMASVAMSKCSYAPPRANVHVNVLDSLPNGQVSNGLTVGDIYELILWSIQ
jgi:hypothetical protein